METQMNYNTFERRSVFKSKSPCAEWIREWVPQDLVATGGKCFVLKWVNENTLKALKEKEQELELAESEPEPTTEVLFLCSFEGCGKTFIDAGALRKHSHIHGERQYVCNYMGCGKKFLDSSKLKRHHLIHTGKRDFVCPHEGCGKAFSLDFNLRSHMKTHSQENYHLCPFPECGKRYAHEYKLKNHLASHHDKTGTDTAKYTSPLPPPERPSKVPKPSPATHGPTSPDRPYACPYEGCIKAYIHEYKLNLHLRREHPDHMSDEKDLETPQSNNDEGSDQDPCAAKRNVSRNQKQIKRKANLKTPPSKINSKKGSGVSVGPSPANLNVMKKQWPVKDEMMYEGEEDDSEETEEEDRDRVDGWRYGDNNNDDDDEETEDEDFE